LLQQINKWFAEAYQGEKTINLDAFQAEINRMIEDLKRELPEN
jgi:cell wall assembly regulator SMI1